MRMILVKTTTRNGIVIHAGVTVRISAQNQLVINCGRGQGVVECFTETNACTVWDALAKAIEKGEPFDADAYAKKSFAFENDCMRIEANRPKPLQAAMKELAKEVYPFVVEAVKTFDEKVEFTTIEGIHCSIKVFDAEKLPTGTLLEISLWWEKNPDNTGRWKAKFLRVIREVNS